MRELWPNLLHALGDHSAAIHLSGDGASLANYGIQIGGANQYGRLAVTGSATLDGTLQVSLLNGYVPALGTNFQILTFADYTGGFSKGIKGAWSILTKDSRPLLTEILIECLGVDD